MSTASELAMIGVRVPNRDTEVTSGCQHHWIIEAPNGSCSIGVCKFCGTEKEFNNSMDRYLIRKKARAQEQGRLAAAARRAG